MHLDYNTKVEIIRVYLIKITPLGLLLDVIKYLYYPYCEMTTFTPNYISIS